MSNGQTQDAATAAADAETHGAIAPAKQMRIVIERHPNPDCTTFNLDRKLGGWHGSLYFGSVDGVVAPNNLFTSSDDDVPVDPFIQSLAEQIYAIPGIDGSDSMSGGVSFSSYSIRIIKAKAFTEAEVEQEALQAIIEAFGLILDQVDVTIESQRNYPRRWNLDEDSLMDDLRRL